METPQSFRPVMPSAASGEFGVSQLELPGAQAQRPSRKNANARIDRFFAFGLSRETAAQFIGVSPTTFDVMVKDGRMPAARRIGARRLWSRVELEIAFDALPKDGDAEANPWDQDAAA